MWEIIRKNKIKSLIALTIMAIWYCAVYGIINGIFALSLVCFLFDDVAFSINPNTYYAIGIIISAIIFFCIFYKKSDKPYEVLWYELRESKRDVSLKLHNIVEEMAIASGLKVVPKIYILDSDILNAYACGINPKNSSIVVTKKLLEVLSRDELQGVIAHETGHIVNRDTMYLMCSGILFCISQDCTKSSFESAKSGGRGSAGLLLIALISKLGELVCFVLLMFISRKREYIADACACQYTRYPKGLADALLKIEHSYCDGDEISSLKYNCMSKRLDYLLKASFIVPLVKQKDNLLSTHPSTQNRIKILLNMKRADVLAYEKEFERLNNEKLISENITKKSSVIEIKKQDVLIQKSSEILSACALNTFVKDDKQAEIIKENKDILEENIKKHREVEDLVYELENRIIINCECNTKLKIPSVYKNTIVICPHCKKKHAVQ